MQSTKRRRKAPRKRFSADVQPEFLLEIGDPMPEGWKVLSSVAEWKDYASRLTHAASQGNIRHARVSGGHGQLIFHAEEVSKYIEMLDGIGDSLRRASATQGTDSDRQLSLLAPDCAARMIETAERLIESNKLLAEQQGRMTEQQMRLTAAIELLISHDSDSSATEIEA